MQQSSDNFQGRAAESLAHAQHSALEMASQMGTLAFNYAMELNKTWFELAQNSMKRCASFPQRLAQCRTPEEVFSTQADLISNATNEYKEGLTAHANMIEKATQDYKVGLDRLTAFGEDTAREMGRAAQQGQEMVQDTVRKATRAAEEQTSQGRGRGSRSERAESEKEDQSQRAH